MISYEKMEKFFSWPFFGSVTGLYLFFKGFHILWKKRLIQNIPTSKIRSIAIGQVEIKGKAFSEKPLKSPISKVPCVYFRYIEERLKSDSRGRMRWVRELDVKSDMPFYLKDETGCILINPVDADTKLPLRYLKRDFDTRYKEYFIGENEEVYILGEAIKKESIYEIERREIERRIKEIMEDPEKKKKLDINKDLWIDKEEWEKVREEIKQQVRNKFRQEKEKETPVSPHLKNVVIGKGNGEFIISTMSEKQLIKNLKIKAILSIFGGAALIIICTKLLLFYK